VRGLFVVRFVPVLFVPFTVIKELDEAGDFLVVHWVAFVVGFGGVGLELYGVAVDGASGELDSAEDSGGGVEFPEFGGRRGRWRGGAASGVGVGGAIGVEEVGDESFGDLPVVLVGLDEALVVGHGGGLFLLDRMNRVERIWVDKGRRRNDEGGKRDPGLGRGGSVGLC